MNRCLVILIVISTGVLSPVMAAEYQPQQLTTKLDIKKSSAALPACPKVSMQVLIERLKATHAIGFFTKLAIRSDVLDFKRYVSDLRRKQQLHREMAAVRSDFNGLILKIVALLEKDPDLSKIIYLARDSIFKSMMEVKT